VAAAICWPERKHDAKINFITLGLLGNLMFAVAALEGLADDLQVPPCVCVYVCTCVRVCVCVCVYVRVCVRVRV